MAHAAGGPGCAYAAPGGATNRLNARSAPAGISPTPSLEVDHMTHRHLRCGGFEEQTRAALDRHGSAVRPNVRRDA